MFGTSRLAAWLCLARQIQNAGSAARRLNIPSTFPLFCLCHASCRVFMALYFNSNIPIFRKLASWNAEKRAHHRHCRRTLVDVGVRTFNLFLTGIRAAKAQKGTRGPRWFKYRAAVYILESRDLVARQTKRRVDGRF